MTKKQKDELLVLLKSRLSLSQSFSRKWRKEVKKWLKDYNIDSFDGVNFPDLHNKMQIPYIFSTIESALPSMFDTVPNIVMLQRGKLDKEFTEFADQIWDYVKDRMRLEDKLEEVGMMFLITGMGNLKWGWELITEEVDGQPEEINITNDDGVVIGTETIQTKVQVPVKDEPFVRWYEYDKIHFSPESRFVMDDEENDIPYVICENVEDIDTVEYNNNIKIEDEDIEKVDFKFLEDDDEELDKRKVAKADRERVHTYEYYGTLPKKYSGDDAWRPDKVYYVLFTRANVYKEPEDFQKKPLNLVGNYGSFNDFLKFGEPKVLRELEQDVSLGRSRMADIRDKYGQKIAIPSGTEVDERALKRPADFTILRYIGNQLPAYLNPPPMPETIMVALSQSRQDIQMASAQLDLSRGGSQSVVDTATGQKIFAEATEKRVDRKKKKIARFIKYIAKNVLRLCAENWDAEKFAEITDLTEEEIVQGQYIEKMQRIGKDYDVRIDIESVSVNRETVAAQAIALYREVRDDPNANSQEALKEALKIGFNIRDFDRFLNDYVSPDDAMKTLEYLVENQIIPQELAGEIAGGIGMLVQQQQQAGKPTTTQTGRPPTNGIENTQNSIPASDSTQITAQTDTAGQQANQPRL